MPAPAIAVGALGGSALTGLGGWAYMKNEDSKRAAQEAEEKEKKAAAEKEAKKLKQRERGPPGGGSGGRPSAAPGMAGMGMGGTGMDEPQEGAPGDEEDPFANVPEPTGDLLQTRPMKFDDISMEAREMCMDNMMEFQEGLVINLSKPIVAPPGTPPPPQGPGQHRNYQAQMMERFVLNNQQTSHATFSIQTTFQPDQRDAISCTYNTQGTHNGLLVRSFGPLDLVMQWMQQPHGMGVGMYASGDCKIKQGTTSFQFIRQQYIMVSHLQGLFRNFYLGTKARYDPMSRETHFGAGFRWAGPNKVAVLSGEFEDSGSVKLSVAKKVAGLADTTFCAQWEYGGLQRPEYFSMTTIGFMREYLNHTRLRIAATSDFQIKSVVEMPIGRVGQCSYNIKYDPTKKTVNHGFSLQM